MDKNNNDIIINNLGKYIDINKKGFIYEFINKLNKDANSNTTGIIEYFILNKIHKIPIIIYDKHDEIMYIIDDNIIYDKTITNKPINDKYKDRNNLKQFINIRFTSISMSNIPVSIEVAYFI
jgi:hypothetical protein